MRGTKDNIDIYAAEFLAKLESLNENEIHFTGYAKDYLLYLIKYRLHYLSIYQSIFQIISENTNADIEDMVFVDFGAGNGLMAMFARLMPFHRVLAIDLDQEFIEAASITAGLLSIEGIEFIHGGEDRLLQLETENKKVVIAGTDVIEHIYDLSVFFKMVVQIPHLLLTVFTTASNPQNPRIVKKLMDLQRREELIGGDSEDRALFGYAHKSFLELRKEIILNFRSFMDRELVHTIARISRGLRKDDIEKLILDYEKKGVLPQEISHPTNTCHPYTGSWSERLIELEDYRILYSAYGLKLFVSNGFYDSQKGEVLRRLIMRFLNWFIRLMPVQGRKISPFIILTGVKGV